MHKYTYVKRGRKEHTLRNDPETVERLCNEYYRLTCYIANRYKNVPFSLRDEIVSDALLILTKCARSFDSSNGTSFQQYLSACLRLNLPDMMKRRIQKEFASLMCDVQGADGNRIFATSPDHTIEYDHLEEVWHEVVQIRKVLTQREYDILLAYQSDTLADVGRKFGITRERTRQIVETAMRKAYLRLKRISEK
jgi:RNA polymerase sigma factor (sigma-70 family)